MDKTYRCPSCGHEITFNEAYVVSGKYCPKCDKRVDIPLRYWEGY